MATSPLTSPPIGVFGAVVEAHGGTSEAQPTPGGGATFVITLPLGAG
jgi:signal transduction histidine kinase